MKRFKSFFAGTLAAGVFCLTSQAQLTVLQPLPTFGTRGDGSLRPGDQPYLTDASQLQRGLAYNPSTGQLLIVDRTGGTNMVWVLDATTGAPILDGNNEPMSLKKGAIFAGGNASFPMNLIGVAEDGAIYVCNLSNSTGAGFPQVRIYRWADEFADQELVYPTAVGVEDPSNGVDTSASQKRWGDTLTVRGSGLDTEVMIANRGTLVAIFKPSGGMSVFTPMTLTSSAPAGALGYGLTFGPGSTFFGTAGPSTGGPLYQMQYNIGTGTNGTATVLNTLSPSVFPGTISPIFYIPSQNMLAGITMVPGVDAVRLYNVANPAAPVLLDRENFFTSNANNNSAGSLTYGNGVLYALDSDNGIMAFSITSAESNPLPPAFHLSPGDIKALIGTNVSLTSAADGTEPISYQWLLDGNPIAGATSATLAITNIDGSDAGDYTVIATNEFGSATSSAGTLEVLVTPPATILAYEPFDYPSAQALTGKSLSPSQNWTKFGTGDDTQVAAGNLSIVGLSPSIGNSITNGGAGGAARLSFETNYNFGTIYYSFAMRVNTVGSSFTSTTGFLAALVNNAASAYGARLGVKAASGGYQLGIARSSSGTVFDPNIYTENQLLFIVGSYTFNAETGDDVAKLWINPASSSFGSATAPTHTVMDTASGGDMALIDQFTFRQNTTANTPTSITYDELRIGTTWASVTPAPTSSPSMQIVRTGLNVTISWPASATGFVLESSPVLPATGWTVVPHTTQGENNVATINDISGNEFLRLRK